MTWISYAQNFEDVMLMRALKDIQMGFYIDVGAQHPRMDSVSRAFYDRGWRGIHVEPVPFYAALLRADRPDETVIQAMLGKQGGEASFYVIRETGLSTAIQSIADEHARNGFQIDHTEVQKSTLAAVFKMAEGREIHWLKIDVEGSEPEVLRGWLRNRARPWIVVVESTLPLSDVPFYQDWEHYLLRRGYGFVYFDGLNRFYVHQNHADLTAAFSHGACVFDDFALSGLASASFCTHLLQRLEHQH
jgi:FkbM family methyltransferase